MITDEVQDVACVIGDISQVAVDPLGVNDDEWVYSPPPCNQREFEFPEDGLSFSSLFDSGNLIQVERLGPFRYNMYTSPDCGNTPQQTNNRQWFHFAIRGGCKGALITFNFIGMMHSKMFTYSWMPVVAVYPGKPHYSRLNGRASVAQLDAMPPTPGYPGFVFLPWKKAAGDADADALADGAMAPPVSSPLGPTEAEGSGEGSQENIDVAGATTKKKKKDAYIAMNLTFEVRIEVDTPLTSPYPLGHPQCPATYVASNHPYSYSTLQQNIGTWLLNFGGGKGSGEIDENESLANNPSKIYFHREILCKTLDGRNVDLLTITDRTGIKSERSPLYSTEDGIPFSSVFCDIQRAHQFTGKQYVVLSARVHPGECPASHMMHGCIDFLLNSTDPRAAALRSRFVFLLIPMINPDGVVRGHSRADTCGVNLNRMYKNPSKRRHPAPYAIKNLLHSVSSTQGRVVLFIDMHAHANKRGTFFYGNSMDAPELLQSLLYAKLVSLNTPLFEFSSSNFSESNMYATGKTGESRDNSSRVTLFQETGLVHSYTIEASHVTGNNLNPIVGLTSYPIDEPEVMQGTPCTRYTPGSFADTAKGLLVSLLDLRGCNPVSRIPNTQYRTTKGILAVLHRQLQIEVAEQFFKIAFMNGGQACITRETTTDPLVAIMSCLRLEDIPSAMTIKDGRGLPPVTIRNVLDFLSLDQAVQILANTVPSGPPRTFLCSSGRRLLPPTVGSNAVPHRRSLSTAASGAVIVGTAISISAVGRKPVSGVNRGT